MLLTERIKRPPLMMGQESYDSISSRKKNSKALQSSRTFSSFFLEDSISCVRLRVSSGAKTSVVRAPGGLGGMKLIKRRYKTIKIAFNNQRRVRESLINIEVVDGALIVYSHFLFRDAEAEDSKRTMPGARTPGREIFPPRKHGHCPLMI